MVIDNYALIEHTELRLDTGLTVITGETGAGKSIMLGALGMLLGAKVDASVLLDKERKCVVEATFDVSRYDLKPLYEANEVEWDAETVIRREVLPTGKTRGFVNDTPASVGFLKELGSRLIDIHSQHQNSLLTQPAFHLWLVDEIAGTVDERAAYGAAYEAMRAKEEELKALREANARQKKEVDYDRHLLSELEGAELKEPDELDTLELQSRRMDKSEELQEHLATCIEALENEEVGVLTQLLSSSTALNAVQEFLPQEEDLSGRVESARIDLDDVCTSLHNLYDSVQLDPEEQARIRERLNLLNSLTHKHQVSTCAELIAIRDELRSKLSDIDSFDERLKTLTAEFKSLTLSAGEKAAALSTKRRSAFPQIKEYIEQQLRQMGMPNARFEVGQTPVALCATGCDAIRLLFAANKNGEPQEIGRVASGGEMSRVMLSVKSLLSTRASLPTIVFDEIDTGVSGEVADKMGAIMCGMSNGMQVVAITHLPQVAARGRQHYRVFKHDTDERTISQIELLDDEARERELASMLSGAEITEAARANARELLRHRV